MKKTVRLEVGCTFISVEQLTEQFRQYTGRGMTEDHQQIFDWLENVATKPRPLMLTDKTGFEAYKAKD